MSMRSALLALALLALTPLPGLAQGSDAEPEQRLIVRFKPQADSVRAKALSVRATRSEARDVAQTRATALGLRRGHALTAGRSLDERTHVVFARGRDAATLARQLAADPEVELAVVDQRRKHTATLANDPLFGAAAVNPESNSGGVSSRVIDQWYLKAPSSTPGQVVSSINAPAAWDISTGSSSVVVAVLDTGVRKDHPDLAAKIVGGYDFIGYGSPGSVSTAVANDSDGADSDATDPGDWVSAADISSGKLGTGCTSDDIGNSSWHGTRVSGLIGASSNNGLGMAGVGWGVRILPVRVLGKCGGYDSDIMAGMRWAAGLDVPGVPTNPNKAKVLNLSLGGSGACGTTGTGALYRETIAAVNAAGSAIVVAAGNSAGLAVEMPGNCPGVVTVAALRHVGTKVGFSSIGSEVTIAAPGGNCINVGAGQACLYPMVSTTNTGSQGPVAADNAYTDSRPSVGTSFSAPVVSGIVALMASVRPTLTASEITTLLKRTARPFVTSGGGSSDDPAPPQCKAPTSTEQLECYCTTSTCGAGMVDAAAVLTAVQALNGATVSIAATPVSGLKAGDTVSLAASITGLGAGRSISSYAWSLVDGGGIVTGPSSGGSTATANYVPSGAGSFTARVLMTDDLGFTYAQQLTVNVAAASSNSSGSSTSSSGGGGGGAASAGWLLMVLVAALALPTLPRRRAARDLRR